MEAEQHQTSCAMLTAVAQVWAMRNETAGSAVRTAHTMTAAVAAETMAHSSSKQRRAIGTNSAARMTPCLMHGGWRSWEAPAAAAAAVAGIAVVVVVAAAAAER